LTESAQARLGRLRHRSMWRGIREMDLILRDFADRELAALPPEDLDAYEAMLAESDHDIFSWIAGTANPPARYAALVAHLRRGAVGLTRPG
jgi:antitoxin CptB